MYKLPSNAIDPVTGQNWPVKYTSSNDEVVKVSGYNVTTLKAGTATVTGTANGTPVYVFHFTIQ